MKKIYILTFFIILLCLFTTTNISQAKSLSDIDTKVKDGHVTLKVNYKGDTYKFFKNGKPVYTGSSNTISSDISKIGDKYKVGIYQNNNLKKVITLNVNNDLKEKTNKIASTETNEESESYPEKLMDSKIENSHINIVASTNNVHLSWDQLPDKDGIYEIYRDDKKIGETTDLSFTDNNVKSGERYNYSINVSIDPSKEQQKEMENKLKEIGSTLTDKEKEEIMSVEGSLSTIVDMPKNEESYLKSKKSVLDEVTDNGKLSTQGKLPKDNMSGWAYRTFIPYSSVADPKPEYKKTFLKGDGRGFSASSNKFRTETNVNTQFTGPTSITMYKKVSQSVRCKDAACTKILDKKTASSSGMKLYINSKKSDYLHWTVTHAIGIPFGSYYPKIDYSYNVMLTRSMASISGKHDKAPNHEFYVSAPSASSATTIYRYAVKSKKDFVELWFLKAKKSWKTELF
ncbi:hypothetical protein [Bacillus vallismortis]|uniref:hypothetical protein n=1 Tax=Bacillus vallismortis TaxID=72361 RepID=UPI0022815D6F|nr:hypothetical protein [Bacillus vallismortis]MCY8546410.1 DUF3238 domain-containing protein [Bacillus vallismortis]MEC1268254.1 hypothetical protein [Bacillus vallismortis]